jgi:RNA polymerase sigma-70 factor (ECF subfamily)
MRDPLVADAMRGDGEAICTLWEQNRRWIAAVLLAHKPGFEDLEDLLQEVAVTFVSKVHTLREEAHLKAWLRTIAVNAARAAGRSGKNRPKPALPEGDLRTAARSADQQLADDEQTRRMLRRVDGLPEAYREPLLLRALHGMKSRQIGEILGIPPATVDTRVARARRMLRTADGAGQVVGSDEPSYVGEVVMSPNGGGCEQREVRHER